MDKAFKYILSTCIPLNRKKICVIYDETTNNLIKFFLLASQKTNKQIELLKISTGLKHGDEPPHYIYERMMKADSIICLTKYSLAHTFARKKTEEIGIQFLSMPDYDVELLKNPALFADYKKISPIVEKYADKLSQSKIINIFTDKGTKLYLNVANRKGNCCPGFTDNKYLLGSPPDIEANISPIESDTNGKIVIDGSITDKSIGLLDKPLVMYVENGSVVKFESEDNELVKTVYKIFEKSNSPKSYIIGELGIGFNDKAFLCGNMLVDEGAKGCIHFGLGSNWTIGGKNKVDFHLDFVMKDSTILADNETIIEKGKLIYE